MEGEVEGEPAAGHGAKAGRPGVIRLIRAGRSWWQVVGLCVPSRNLRDLGL